MPDEVGCKHLFLRYIDRAIRFCFLLDYVNCLDCSKLAWIAESFKQIDQQPITQQQDRYDGAQPSYRRRVHPLPLVEQHDILRIPIVAFEESLHARSGHFGLVWNF